MVIFHLNDPMQDIFPIRRALTTLIGNISFKIIYLFTADFCAGKKGGDYADPSNPSGYISCSGGITYERNCPAGLVWNDTKKICDWAQKGQDAKAAYRPPEPVKLAQLPVKPKQN